WRFASPTEHGPAPRDGALWRVVSSRALGTGAMTITLITGAHKGLGYETARRLIDLGHTVLAGGRGPQRGSKAAQELGATFINIDPTDDDSVKAAAARGAQ